jgi:transposase-like protein
MPAGRVAMRQVREIIRLKFSAGIPTREIARRLGVAASTVRETLRRFEVGGLGWPLPNGMSDGHLEAALYANHGTKRGHRRHAEPDWPTVHRELKRKHVHSHRHRRIPRHRRTCAHALIILRTRSYHGLFA